MVKQIAIPGVGAGNADRLLEDIGSPRRLWNALPRNGDLATVDLSDPVPVVPPQRIAPLGTRDWDAHGVGSGLVFARVIPARASLLARSAPLCVSWVSAGSPATVGAASSPAKEK